MTPRISAVDRLDALPATALALVEAVGRRQFHLAPDWWRCMQEHACPPDARARYLLAEAEGRALSVLPLWAGPGRQLAGLANPYSVVYAPLLAPDLSDGDLVTIGRGFARMLRGAGVVRLDALDADAPWLAGLLAGLRAGGLVALRFDHFGNWWEPAGGRGWTEYLADRPGRQRETVRRRLARAGRDASIVIERITGGAALEDGIAAYLAVYARSWKSPEPFAGFNPAVMRAAAAAGRLRLWVLRQAGQPVAAQYWVLAEAGAMVLKLAHDEAAVALSPGTVLTAHAIRDLLDNDHVASLDFGRGDDPYKADWCTQRRQRIGLLLCNPWSPVGAAAIARHRLGQLRRR
jgi:hypothetical protein